MLYSGIRNIVFITVDSFKFGYLHADRNRLNICPVINSLATNGILATNARTHGFPTQMSFPSSFSSTLPLDCGGYDIGLLKRPVTLPEALQYIGIHTVGFSSSPWLSRFFMYHRGFDEFHELFDIQKFWMLFTIIYVKYYALLLEKELISKSEFVDILGPVFSDFFSGFKNLCIGKQRENEKKKFPYRIELHRHNFRMLQKASDRMLRDFQKDPNGFMVGKMKRCIDTDITMFLLGKPARSVWRSLLTKSMSHLFGLFMLQLWRHEYSVPASYLAEQVILSIRKNQRRPFFIWTHFLDIHDKTYISGNIGMPPNFLTLGLGHFLNKSNSASLTQTFSVRFVDSHIAQIVAALKSQGLFESTLIIIAGDHGTYLRCPEKMAGSLFDESTHVPLIFSNPNIEPRIVSEPCGLMDIAPTILDLLGKEPCQEFKGRSLMRTLTPDYPVILESLGPGPCDLRFKAIKMAVVRGKYKLIWREPGYEKSCPPGANYLFNLETDPAEKNNLYSEQKYSKVVSELESIVHERCRKLRRRYHETGQTDGC